MSQPLPDATTRWQGYTHTELYRLLNEGAGPKASAEPSRRWAELERTLSDVGQDLRSAIDRTSSGWSGRAAGAAYDQLAVLVHWAQRTSGSAGDMRLSVETQAEHLAKARADMPPPDDTDTAVAAPPPDPAVAVVTAGTDKEPIESSASTGAQKAFEVMATYQRNSDSTALTMAQFSAPTQVTGTFDIYRNPGTGVTVNTPIVAVGVPAAGPPPRDDDDDDRGRGHHRGDLTEGAAAELDFRRPQLQAPSSFTVAAPMNEPLFGLGLPLSAGGSSSGRGGGRTSSLPPTSGGGPVPHHHNALGSGPTGATAGAHPAGPDFQSAAAGQAAAAAGTPSAGAAPGGAASGYAGTQDRAALRRLGAEVIGSGQWFEANDPDSSESVRGASPARRRREFRDDHVTESVSIDGEEHRLPPNVIGD
jgi:hypothetical protein